MTDIPEGQEEEKKQKSLEENLPWTESPYELSLPPSPEKKALSKKGWAILAVVLAVLVAGAAIGAGFVVHKVLYVKDETRQFVLEDTTEYREALINIENYYYHDFSMEKITSAAKKGVEEAKKKGVKSHTKLLDAGLKALAGALGDKHSEYLTPEVNRRLAEDLSGKFYGVGFTLRLNKEKMPVVVSVIEGAPSYRAGIKANDVILSVDGKSTKGMGIDSVVLMIRGKKGTTVTLKIQRPGVKKTLTFKMKREKIVIPDFEYEVLDGKYGLLKLSDFNKGVSSKVRKAVRELEAKGVQGFILDLRNNPGGLLDEAVKVSEIFLKDGVVVSYETKSKQRVEERASGNQETKLPLVVLVNGASASSSEIAAGALNDYNRAVLVGEKTFGKGSIQKVFDLRNGGSVKLTVGLYFLPGGESINGKGIEPDVKVGGKNGEEKDKLQLEKAKEVLDQILKEGKPTSSRLIPVRCAARAA